MSNTKTLVAYFSASGVTANMAKAVAEAAGADLFEIKPAAPYTDADLNWNDPRSRSSVEMNDPASRPAIANRVENMQDYDAVLIGFPIWWYVAPKIIDAFLESYDFSEKTIALFATSGGSGMGKTEQVLKPLAASSAKWLPGKRLGGKRDADAWVKSLNL